jgi:hypothetical protein
MERFTIINALIKRYNFRNYLEIGVSNPYDNYLKVQCENKECVDPYYDTRDLWFSSRKYEMLTQEEYDEVINKINEVLTYQMSSDEFFAQNTKKYDIIFIDGLHTKEQVAKDISNALKCLNKGGKIIVHDCLPPSEESQLSNRPKGGPWCGDVWRAIPEFIYQNVNINVVNCDYGCAVIDYYEKPEEITAPNNFRHVWTDFACYRDSLMHVVSPECFLLLLLIDK